MSKNLLFSPYELGPIRLPNRMVMAPMSRRRAEKDGVPNDLMVEYYVQRVGAGLIVTEAVGVSRQAHDWPGSPGIYTEEQKAGWKRVAAAIHSYGGRVFMQLGHLGRMSHPEFHDGKMPVAPSPIAAKAKIESSAGLCAASVPRELGLEEIKAIVDDFAQATLMARKAGLDGVEISAANGYLLDQFLRDGSNHRSDRYGGSIANRSRLLVAVVRAAAEVWAPEYIGVRLSPTCKNHGMHDSDPVATFSQVAQKLNRLGVAYLHVQEALPGHYLANPVAPRVTPSIRKAFRGAVIVNGGYDLHSGHEALENREADLVSFGMPWLANPDLVRRFQLESEINRPDLTRLVTPGALGYTDYPSLP